MSTDEFASVIEFGAFQRFLQFAMVGASGVLVNVGTLWVLTEIFGIFYLLSAAIGIELSILSNFVLNDSWTFNDRLQGAGSKAHRLLRFNLVYLAGLAINLSILWLLTEYAGVFYILSNLVGIAVATGWNYAFSNLVVWQ